MIQVELMTNNFPEGNNFRDTIVGISGAPFSGKSQTAVVLGAHLAKTLDCGLTYVDCDQELKQENLATWDILEAVKFSYHDFMNDTWCYNFDASDKAKLKSMNNVIIVDAIPKLHPGLSVVEILNFLYFFLKKRPGNVVIAVNHVMGTDVPWYDNFYSPYFHYDLSVKPTLTEKQREKEFKLTTEFESKSTIFNPDIFSGKVLIQYPKGATDE